MYEWHLVISCNPSNYVSLCCWECLLVTFCMHGGLCEDIKGKHLSSNSVLFAEYPIKFMLVSVEPI